MAKPYMPVAHRFKSWGFFLVFLLAVSAILAAVPQFAPPSVVLLVMLANIYAMFAIGWDILCGYTGQLSFGHSFLIGLGAYGSGMLTMYLPDWLRQWFPAETVSAWMQMPGWTWLVPLGMLVGTLVALIGGLLLAFPGLRLHGPYFSLITLVTPLVASRLVQVFSDWTGGENGLGCTFDLSTLTQKCVASAGLNITQSFYVSIVLLAVLLLLLYALAKSRIGKIFEAIREDEKAAEAAGINTAKYKTLAFAVSATVVGLAGAFFVHFYFGSLGTSGTVPRTIFSLDLSVEILLAGVLGGMGTILGPFFGAYFLIIIRDSLDFLGEWRLFIFAVIAIVILYFLPRGTLTETMLYLRRRKQNRLSKSPGD